MIMKGFLTMFKVLLIRIGVSLKYPEEDTTTDLYIANLDKEELKIIKKVNLSRFFENTEQSASQEEFSLLFGKKNKFISFDTATVKDNLFNEIFIVYDFF